MKQQELPFEPGFRVIKPSISAEELRDEVDRIIQASRTASAVRLRRSYALEAWEEECLRQRGVEIIRSKHLC